MRYKNLKKMVICFLLLLGLTVCVGAAGEETETKTVRVGFFYLEGYHVIDNEGFRDGYGYALMQNIRRYADLNFEYVGYDRTWADMLSMLENGEIDVLSYAAVTPERLEKFLYSDVPVGNCDVIVSVKAGNRSIVQDDYRTYDGKRVGFIKGIAENEIFADFAREKGFSYQALYYGDTVSLSAALQSGEVDCIVYTDFRSGQDEWIVERLAASDIHLIVRKDDAELMKELDNALKRLDSNEAGWRGVLKNTYYPYSGTTVIYFNLRERLALDRWGEGGDMLTVVAAPDNMPYSWYGKDEDGNPVALGIYNDFFRQMAEELGIRYEYIFPETPEMYQKLVCGGGADIVIDMPVGHAKAEKYGYIQSPAYDTVSMARVYTRKFKGTVKTIGYLDNAPYMLERLEMMNPGVEIISFAGMEEAVRAVEQGEVDFLYCLDHTAKTIVNQDEMARFRYSVVGNDTYSFTVAVRDDLDRALVSAVSKIVRHSGGRIIAGLYNDNINFGVNPSLGLAAAFYNNPVPVVVAGSVIVMLLSVSVGSVILARRREREMVLRKEVENSVLLRAMYTAMPFGLLRLEITDGEYRITYANRHFFEMMGVTRLEDASALYKNGLGKGLIDCDREDVRTMYDKLREVGDSTTAESRARSRGGAVRWIRCNSTLVDIVGRTRVVQQLILDITEERETREQVEREHTEETIGRMFGTLSRASADMYVLYSLDRHMPRFISPNTEQQLGISLEEAYRNIGVFEKTEIDGKPEETKARILAVEKGEFSMGEVKRVNLKTGEIRWYRDEVYVSPIGDERHVIIVMADITQEQSRREALQTALENAENASRAKTTFLSNMSHDIRTPMNTIVGLTNLLKTGAGDGLQSRRHLDNLEIAANSMMEIINNILDMSRIESGSNTLNEAPFSLRELLREVDAISSTQAQIKGLRVQRTVELKEENYIGDALKLKQVLLNLVSNAVKYTNEGGEIVFVASTVGVAAPDRSMVRFVVRDTGIGMSEEYLHTIFTPFTRERNTTTSGIIGTGLGMAIVKNMVDLMGGHIHVDSAVGAGTTFTVDIPLRPVEETPEEQKRFAERTAGGDISGVRLLVAEDNDLNAEILMELLSREGAECRRAENGQAAVTLFESSAEDAFDMILMDIQMPVMDGYDATRAIRAGSHPRAKTIPISAMTANAFSEDIENARAAGMDAHVAKPVDMAVLKETITSLLKRW